MWRRAGIGFVRQSCRSLSQACSKSGVLAQELTTRRLLQVRGLDALNFLQGLVTNDVEYLSHTCRAMYSMVLNIQGRTLYDIIVYREGEERYLVECDATLAPDLLKHLKMYKIRKKVSLADVSDEFAVTALTPAGGELSPCDVSAREGEHVPLCVPDPRLPTLGSRLITARGTSVSEVVSGCEVADDLRHYEDRRYRLGVPEGPVDLPPGNSLPLESNLTFLHGVSFSKGCYIGQELTARTHHTGVIRKRLMPISIDSGWEDLESGAKVESAGGKNVGKYRTCVAGKGLALLRVAEVTREGGATVHVTKGDGSHVEAVASVPAWWPHEELVVQKQTKS